VIERQAARSSRRSRSTIVEAIVNGVPNFALAEQGAGQLRGRRVRVQSGDADYKLLVTATVEIYDRLEAIVELGVPNFALAEYKAPENYAVADCPMCQAGTPITSF
jgi:hypothetical protein